MNFVIRSSLLSIVLSLAYGAQAIPSENFEYTGYFRAGTATNSLGGDQQCFKNSGSSGNEFRLGNECGIYGEATLTAHQLRGGEADPFFKGVVTLAYISPGHKSYEGSSEEIHVTEAFAQGGRVHDTPYTFWIGKRFYRGPNIYMNDWWYYGDTAGNGAGIEEIPVGFGKLAVAQLRQIHDTISSDVGRHGLTLWDVRLSDIKVGETSDLAFWLGYAHSPNGTSGATVYEKATGYVLGTKFHQKLGQGFNEIVLIAGQGLMQSLDLTGDSAPIEGTSTQDKAQRVRLADHWAHEEAGSRWAWQVMASHEQWDTGAATKSGGTWSALGVQPIFFVTDHVHLTGVLGASQIEVESEVDGAGDPLGSRTLFRATIAPQLAVSRSVWGRPVLRAFYTQSWWNKENKTMIATGAPAYADRTSGAAYGFQAEVWF